MARTRLWAWRTSEVAVAATPSPGSVAIGLNLNTTPQFSEGGCGFLQRCIFLNQKDQGLIAKMGVAAIAVVICTIGTAVCAVAAAVAIVLEAYFDNHGLCSGGRKLQVRYFPRSAEPEVRGLKEAHMRLLTRDWPDLRSAAAGAVILTVAFAALDWRESGAGSGVVTGVAVGSVCLVVIGLMWLIHRRCHMT